MANGEIPSGRLGGMSTREWIAVLTGGGFAVVAAIALWSSQKTVNNFLMEKLPDTLGKATAAMADTADAIEEQIDDAKQDRAQRQFETAGVVKALGDLETEMKDQRRALDSLNETIKEQGLPNGEGELSAPNAAERGSP